MTTPRPCCTCVACVLALDAAPRTLALLCPALVHAGPAGAVLQVLVAGLVEAFLWGSQREAPAARTPPPPCRPPAPQVAGALRPPPSQDLARPRTPRPAPRSPTLQSLPVKATGQVQWWDAGAWVLVHEPPLRQGPEAQGSAAARAVQATPREPLLATGSQCLHQACPLEAPLPGCPGEGAGLPLLPTPSPGSDPR